MNPRDALLIGYEGDFARALGRSLGAECFVLARGAGDAALEAWRAGLAAERGRRAMVVALAPERPPAPRALEQLDEEAWSARAAEPFLAWCVALGAAAECCADGGAIVAVAEAPPPLDASGFAPEAGLSDAVGALVRSIAASEGGRGVRANAVTTPARLASGPESGAAAAGDPGDAVAGAVRWLLSDAARAVRWLLSDAAAAINGRTLPADGVRSW